MSTAEILSLVSMISYAIAAVSAVLAVFFWFKFKISVVIGDLSGWTAKKSIAQMRARNEKAGGQGFRPSAANVNRGKLTDTMQHSRKLEKDSDKKSTEAKNKKTDAASQMPETGLLRDNLAAADRQEVSETTGLLVDDESTAPLREESRVAIRRTGGKKLTMIDEVMLIHTDEEI